MNKAERALVDCLKPMMESRGFKHRASKGDFVKKQEFGFLRLAWGSFRTKDDGGREIFTLGLGVRHNRVDDIVNQLGHIGGDDNRKNTTTVYRGLSIFPFHPDWAREKVIRLSHIEQDAEAVAASIQSMLLSDGLAFYDRYSSLLECSRGLNEPIEARKHPLFNNFPIRAYYGVAAAGLVEPGRVSRLIPDYIDFAQRNKLVDPFRYTVAKDLVGLDAITARLNFVAERAMAARA